MITLNIKLQVTVSENKTADSIVGPVVDKQVEHDIRKPWKTGITAFALWVVPLMRFVMDVINSM